MNHMSWMSLLAVVLFSSTSGAQTTAGRFPVQIDVLIQPTVSHNVSTRRWSPIFQKLGQSVTFRSGRTGERVSTLETDHAGRKGVKVIGLLNNDGTIRFPGKTFNSAKPSEVAVWLERLKQHGARGPVNEDATWGLSTDDFKKIVNLLAAPVNATVRDGGAINDVTVINDVTAINDVTVTSAIDSLDLPKSLQIRFTDKARLKAAQPAARIANQPPDCSQLTKGSALAVVLAQFGLGFRPKKNRDGRYVLEVDVGSEGDNLYPVGWKNEAPITIAVRNLVKRFDVSLEDQNTNLVIQLLAKKLELPYAYSADALVKARKNPDELKYSRKSGKASAYRLIESIEARHGLGISFRTDEAGQIFMWVTTQENEKAFDQRFKHMKPKLSE